MTQALFVMLCLVLSAVTASAECAWVLWMHSIGPVEVFSISEAHPSMKECSQSLVGLGQTMKSKGYRVNGVTAGSRSATYRLDEDRGYLLCLPDTVDPRGPKGR